MTAWDDVARADADPPAASPGGIDLAFRPDVEGLRAVAITLVVLYHCGYDGGGFIGVDVFFVISGFLITGLLLREHEKRKRISIPGFYARRARRILPAGMLVIVATVLWAHQVENWFSYQYTREAGQWASMFMANIHFAAIGTNYATQQQSATPNPLLHYWSLAVEEQFYFVWPTVVFLVGLCARWIPLRRLVLVTALAASVASFLWALHTIDTNVVWAFYSPLTRAWELGLGAVAATLVIPLSRLNRWVGVGLAWAGMGAIAFAAATFDLATDPFPGKAALVPVLGAVAVIAGGTSGIGAGHFLGLAPTRSVGRVSYGWYLLHYPPMVLLAGIQGSYLIPRDQRLVVAVVTLGVAYVMYYVLEKPIRRSRMLAVRPWASIAMGLSLVTAAFLVCSLLNLQIV
jgi:peptidoglycan/LPS O-acetylase OafA/YrhL